MNVDNMKSNSKMKLEFLVEDTKKAKDFFYDIMMKNTKDSPLYQSFMEEYGIKLVNATISTELTSDGYTDYHKTRNGSVVADEVTYVDPS